MSDSDGICKTGHSCAYVDVSSLALLFVVWLTRRRKAESIVNTALE